MIGCLLLVFCSTSVYPQDDQVRVYMYLDYFQTTDYEYLQAELKYRDADRQFQQLGNVEVSFYLITDAANTFIGKNQTLENGLALMDLSKIQYQRDSSGKAEFEAIFAGNDSYRKASRDVETQRANLSLDLKIVDSIKKVLVQGNRIGQTRAHLRGRHTTVRGQDF